MIVYKCNECGVEIPIVKKEIFGQEVEILDCGQLECKEIIIDNTFLEKNIHLCKPCAKSLSAQIDYELLKFKTEILQKESKK